MNELLDKLEEWARKAWNWLENFFKKIWGRIRHWLEKFRQWAINKLKNKDEIIVIKPTYGNNKGRDIYEAVKDVCPDTTTLTDIENGNGLLTASVEDDEIVDVEELLADTQEYDNLDRALDQNDGVIRISDL